MTIQKIRFGGVAALLLAAVFLLVESHAAFAQSTRYWNRSVAPGKKIEFQWLNYDERTCKDNGYPRLVIDKAPKLGKFRTSKRRFTQQNGSCKGKRFSVLLVNYVAGRKKGTDSAAFTIKGRDNLRINLKISVK